MKAGDNLVITTTTPGGSSANGQQFINNLDPTINLYDANDNLVATATGNAADGRNDVIDFTALSPGSYRVQILGANQTTWASTRSRSRAPRADSTRSCGVDQPGRRQRYQLPGRHDDRDVQQQHPADAR